MVLQAGGDWDEVDDGEVALDAAGKVNDVLLRGEIQLELGESEIIGPGNFVLSVLFQLKPC